jgi:hypothetical protein
MSDARTDDTPEQPAHMAAHVTDESPEAMAARIAGVQPGDGPAPAADAPPMESTGTEAGAVHNLTEARNTRAAVAAALGLAPNASVPAMVRAVETLKAAPSADEALAAARTEGARAVQARVFGILELPEAAGREQAAFALAKIDGMTPEVAAEVLRASPMDKPADVHQLRGFNGEPLSSTPQPWHDAADSESESETEGRRIASL